MSLPPTTEDKENLPEAPSGQLGYAVTALIFFALGFMVAGLLGVQFLGGEGPVADPQVVGQAVAGTMIALTPSPTPSPSPVPPQLTYSSSDHSLNGATEAAVVFVEFSDYQCPYCGHFAQQVMPILLEYYGDLVNFVYRDFPIFGEQSLLAAHAATCAADQDRFSDYHFALFQSQAQDPRMPLEAANFLTLAQELGLESASFSTCLAQEGRRLEIVQNFQEAQELLGGEVGTPTFLLNGRRIQGTNSLQYFIRVINEELQKLGIEPPA
jgi:protein-disulfide isomerase